MADDGLDADVAQDARGQAKLRFAARSGRKRTTSPWWLRRGLKV